MGSFFRRQVSRNVIPKYQNRKEGLDKDFKTQIKIQKKPNYLQQARIQKERNRAQINLTSKKKSKKKGIQRSKKKEVFKVSETGNPNSCVVEINKTRWRALVDTGAEVSLISESMYSRLRKPPKLKVVNQELQGAGGHSLSVKGVITLTFRLGKREYEQNCYVVRDASRNMILGCDFLKKNQARIYFDLEKLRLNGQYVDLDQDIHIAQLRLNGECIDLDQDIHIASVVRLTNDVKLPPQTGITVYGRTKKNTYYQKGQMCEFKQDNKTCVTDEPGMIMANSISELDEKGRCKFMMINSTNKTYNLKRGSVMGTLTSVNPKDVNALGEVLKEQTKELPRRVDFSETKVPEEHRVRLVNLLEKNTDVFAAHETDFGRTDTVKMKIDTQGSPPIKQRSYRTPISQFPVIDEAVDQMLKNGIIERSQSPWASPIVLVRKKDGSTRLCVDYRKLNQGTKPLAYPLPVIDDLLGVLGKAVYFSSLDLISGYWQICMEEEDKEKTAFCTSHRGLYQFKVMPFGLMNAPGVFSQLISQVLEGCEQFSTAYIDDILCFSETLEDHMKHLQIIFDRLRKHGLKLKLKKCTFLQPETSYLGYRVTSWGIQPEMDKVEAIRKLNPPTTKKEIRSFIGSCSYYRKFLPNFSGIARPLIDLTKKNTRFKWTEEHQEAFDFLKESLTAIPFLSYPDMTKDFTLYTDASDTCIGACLTQIDEEDEEVPVYFVSHKLSDTQTRWSTIEKEAYAIFYAVTKLNYILYGAHFTIKTDHQPLIYLLNAPSNNKKIQNWMLQLSAYNCRIEHIKGTDNAMADMLSRAPEASQQKQDREDHSRKETAEVTSDVPDQTYNIGTLDSGKFVPKQYAHYQPQKQPEEIPRIDEGIDIVEEQKKDPQINKILEELKTTKGKAPNRYIRHEDAVYYLSHPHGDATLRLYVPEQLRPNLIKAYHDENGHFGVDKCYHSLARSYFWPNMFRDL